MNHSWVLNNHRSKIQPIIEKAAAVCRQSGLSDSLINDVRLCLEEVLMNIVSHGFEKDGDHQIHLDLRITDNVLCLETRDGGKPFDPTTYSSPEENEPFDRRRIGGFGITLVRNLTDEMVYERRGDNNILTMIKKIGP